MVVRESNRRNQIIYFCWSCFDVCEELKADIVITATGLQLNVMGDIEVTVDGQIVDFLNVGPRV